MASGWLMDEYRERLHTSPGPSGIAPGNGRPPRGLWVVRRKPLPPAVVVVGTVVVLTAALAVIAVLPPDGHFRAPH